MKMCLTELRTEPFAAERDWTVAGIPVLTATVEVSRNYRSFSGLTDGMDGAVRFIYRTEAVEKAE